MKRQDVKCLRQFVRAMRHKTGYEVKSKHDAVGRLAELYEKDLERAHNIVSRMLEKLDDEWDKADGELFAKLFGEKETAIGALTKLSAMLLKFIPLEQEMQSDKHANEDVNYDHLSQQDAEFLEQYIDYTLKNSCLE